MQVVWRQECVQAVGAEVDELCWFDTVELKNLCVSDAMTLARWQRDNCDGLHITLVTRDEIKALRTEGNALANQFARECIDDKGRVALGLGCASDLAVSAKTHFVVVVWPSVQTLRESLSLPRKDLHITVGFSGSDVHTCSKSSSSLVHCKHGVSAAQLNTMITAAEKHCVHDEDKSAIFKAVEFHASNDSDAPDALFKALLGLALIAGRRRWFSKALVFAERALRLRETPRVLLILGDAHNLSGDLEAAVASYSKGVALCVEHRLWPIRSKLLARVAKAREGKLHPILAKFPRTPHVLNLGAATRDDLLLSKEQWVPFLCSAEDALQTKVIVEEKIDGANLGVWFDEDWTLMTKNRSHFVCSSTGSQWTGLDAWLDKNRVRLAIILGQRFVLYGEWLYACHSLAYDALPALFVAFDLFDRVAERFLSVASRDRLLKGSGIPIVATVRCGAFENAAILEAELCALVANRPSKYRLNNQSMEGVVMRCDEADNENTLTFQLGRAKLVRTDFIQGIKQHWTRLSLVRNVVRPELFTEELKESVTTTPQGNLNLSPKMTPAMLLPVVGTTKYHSTPHLPFSQYVHLDDMDGTKRGAFSGSSGVRVIVIKKLDSGNCCLRDGMVFVNTHEVAHWWFGAVKQLYLTLRMKHHDLFETKYPGLELYGESMTAILSISHDRLCPPLYLFAAACRNAKTGDFEWLSWDEVCNIAQILELPTVPLVFDGRVETLEQVEQLLKIKTAKHPPTSSEISGEGFVVRVAQRVVAAEFDRCVFKYVRDKHVQTYSNWKNTCAKVAIAITVEEGRVDMPPIVLDRPLQLYVSLEGTLANFDRMLLELPGRRPREMTASKMWRCIEESHNSFGSLEWMPCAKRMWDEHLALLNPTILSDIPDNNSQWIEEQKLAWIVRNLGTHVPVIFCAMRDKNKYSGDKTKVLIDCKAHTKRLWEEKKGVFIHHTSVETTVQKITHLLQQEPKLKPKGSACDGNDDDDSETNNLVGGEKSKKKAGAKNKHNVRPVHLKKPKYQLLCLVGFPGSGKSSFAQALCAGSNCTRVCQDELGSRIACKNLVRRSIKFSSVCVDRCNVTTEERALWLAKSKVEKKRACIVHFTAVPDQCIQRIVTRTEHKTINTTCKNYAAKIVYSCHKRFKIPVAAKEGYAKVFTVNTFKEADELLARLL